MRRVWALRCAVPPAAFEPVFPDGCVELVINLADPFARLSSLGIERQPEAIVVGQMTGPTLIRPTGRVDLVGVRLQPWGAQWLLDDSARTLEDRIHPADTLERSRLGSLRTRLGETFSLAARCRLLLGALRHWRRVSDHTLPPSPVFPALATGGVTSVSQAARLIGRSVRQLERMLLDTVGLPPAQLIRLARFQRALRRLTAQPRLALARIALDAGFSDQSHLTRDFRQFAGMTPGDYRRTKGILTPQFIEVDEGTEGNAARRQQEPAEHHDED